MLKSVLVPYLKGRVVFGRKHPTAHSPHMRLSRYLKTVPTPPSTVDYSGAALPSLTNIFGNDTLGDCVIAGGYHIEGVATGNAGKVFVANNAQILADYKAIGGYIPGKPSTDNGCDLQAALNYWSTHGFANGTKLAGWLSVDPTNPVEIKQALYLFENLYFGIDLPDSYVTPFPSKDGFVWDIDTPNQDNGHCISGFSYNTQGVGIATWGMRGIFTWRAITSLALPSAGGELYVMLTPDIISKATAKAPTGFNWTTLVSDFDALGGHVPVPAPIPVPTPPAPVTGVTLQQAVAWATQGLTQNWPK